ncbi:MAG: hypothetical protein RLZZ389_637 [Actinomycetota bacterium]
MFAPKTTVYAHCDLPCGVYDPAQAKIEALSVKACMEKYAANTDPDFRSRSVATSRLHTSRRTHSCTHCSMRQQSLQVLQEQRELRMLQLQIH